MTPAALALLLAGALVGLAVVLNHCYARVALVELALNEGLPPGHSTQLPTSVATQSPVEAGLSPGVHVFLSRNCHACQRLLDELDAGEVSFAAPLSLHYVDRPRPQAAGAASKLGATLHDRRADLVRSVGADPLPYTIAIGRHGLIGRMVTPTLRHMQDTARDAGIVSEL